MADERIDIEVADKVAKTIKPELLGIGAAAKQAHPEIAKLKASLAGFNFSGMAQFRKMAADANALSVATNKLDAAQTKAALSAQRLALAEAKTALAQERVRTQAAKTAAIETQSYLANERALNQAVVAENNAAASKDRTAAASLRAATAANKEAEAAERLTNEYRQQAAAAKAQQGINGAFGIGRQPKSAKDSYDVFNQAGKIDETTRKLDEMGKKAELGRHHLLNLGFQLQDIFVSLASGQKPLTVFIQQGGQIGQIAAQSGVGFGAMAKAVGGMLLRFAPLVGILGAGAAGLALVSREANKDESIKKYANSLGLTAKEMKKLEDVTVTTGDTMQAVWNVTLRNIAAKLGIDTKRISSIWNSFLDTVASAAKVTLAGIYAAFVGMSYGVENIIKNLGDGKDNDNPIAGMIAGYKEAYNDALGFMGDVGKEQERLAKERVKTQADELKADRTPKSGGKGAKGVDRAAELAKVNRELDQEFKLLQLIGKERDNETRWLDISNGLIDKKIKLTDKETASIKAKIAQNRNEQDINSAMQSFYEEIHGPQKTFEDGTEALNRLMSQGKIEVADYNRQMALLNRNYADSVDYLAPITRELDKQAKLVGTFGRNREYAEFLQQMEDAAGPGRSIYKQASNDNSGDIIASGGKTLTNQAQLLANDFVEGLKKADMTSAIEEMFNAGNSSQLAGGNQWVIDNYKEMYAQIDEMRKSDQISEAEAARTKHELDKRYFDARLEGAEKMFGNLTGLQSSHSKEVAAIGKAAAIAQATIDGIRAVQAALAGPPGPPWSIPIAISAGVMAAANVAKIAGIGFQKGGYTGDLPSHAVAGAVHGQEFVMDAKATSRIGVANLEAMRNGRLNPAPAANNNGPKVTVINNAGAAVQVRERSDGELEILVESALERKMGPMFERRLSNPNSRESRAIGNNTTARRNRS